MKWLCAPLAVLLACVVALCQPVSARDVVEIESPTGIKAWLVADPGVPIVAIGFAFVGGSAQDPPDRTGLATVLAAMLDQGAGEADAATFEARLGEVGSRLSFSASQLAIGGGLLSLKRHLPVSAALLRDSLVAPRFAPDRLVRVQSQLSAELAADATHPATAAHAAFAQEAFAGHPFARPVKGDAAGIAAVTTGELARHHRRLVARDSLRLVLVGDLAPDEARALIDTIFAALPAASDRAAIATVAPSPFEKRLPGLPGQVFETAVFALPAPALGHEGFFAALAVNHITGSGNLDARLTRALRVERGLTYAVASALVATPQSSYILGSLSTRPGKMDEAVAALKETLAEIAREGIGEAELSRATSGLIGSYLVQHDTSAALAAHLLALAVDGLPPDYAERRRLVLSRLDAAVASRAARVLLDPDKLSILVLGAAP
ncbi:MAG: pitrilysin family protein [Hyphomicrobiaceae bacterium]|nr:pitrilysin family protein [Hyphomicrobiaceae bacterium]